VDEADREFRVEARPDPESRRYEIRGAFFRSGERLGMDQAEHIFDEGLLVQGGSVAPFQGPFRWISLFRKEGSFFVPYDEADRWIETMMQIPSPPCMELPEELRLQELAAEPRPVAHVRASKAPWNASNLVGEVFFDYLGRVVSESDPASGIVIISERKKIERNRDENRAAHFEQAGFKEVRLPRPDELMVVNPPAVGRRDRERRLARRGRRKLFSSPNSVSTHLSSGIDWFSCTAHYFGESRILCPNCYRP
jgi:hypothetical protein